MRSAFSRSLALLAFAAVPALASTNTNIVVTTRPLMVGLTNEIAGPTNAVGFKLANDIASESVLSNLWNAVASNTAVDTATTTRLANAESRTSNWDAAYAALESNEFAAGFTGTSRLDRFFIGVSSSQLTENADFSSPSNWSGINGFSVTQGVAFATNAFGGAYSTTLHQDMGVTSGETYLAVLVIDSMATGATLDVVISGQGSVYLQVTNAGTFASNFTATATGALALRFNATNAAGPIGQYVKVDAFTCYASEPVVKPAIYQSASGNGRVDLRLDAFQPGLFIPRIVTNANVTLIVPAFITERLVDVGSNKTYTAYGLTTNDWRL